MLAWDTADFRVPTEVGPGGGAKCNCDTTNINHMLNNGCTDEICRLDLDLCSSLPCVHGEKVGNIRSMIHGRIHSTGMDPAMAQPHNC